MTQTASVPDEEMAALYARTCPRLVGLLTCIAGSRSDAEEVAQDAFVKLLGRWARLGLARSAGRAERRTDHPPPGPDAVDVAAALRTLPQAELVAVAESMRPGG